MVNIAEQSVCSECGSALTHHIGCMPCQLRVGFEAGAANSASEETPEQLANYRIARRDDGTPWELGRGSMGITYRALDVPLNRPVAIKIVAPVHAGGSSAARERFLREARIAAQLRHPNIATVYQFGVDEDSGHFFYAMELVEGETLEERVRRSGPLDAQMTIVIAQQIVAALAVSEKNALIHRDLKPANVMLVASDEAGAAPIVKIIDFGLAKALTAPVDPMSATQAGFVGTPAFASPEQFAHAPLDVRSDIYSLGATLWFGLTGRTPFQSSSVDIIQKAQKNGSLPIDQLRAAGVPKRLIALLCAMLAPEPAARPSLAVLAGMLERCRFPGRRRAIMVSAALLAVSALGVAVSTQLHRQNEADPVQPSVAVLPFDDLNSETRDTSVADGVHEDLLVALSKIAQLKVISRNSVMQYRGTGRDLREIGEALGVSSVLEGRVHHDGDVVRINVQLIRAADGMQIWAANYENNARQSFAAENDIALQIAAALKAHVSSLDVARIRQPLTKNREAYLRFVEGKNLYLDYRKLQQDLDKAEQLLEQAVALDPQFAAAYARLAQVESTYFEMYGRDPRRREKSLAAANEALKLQPDLPEAHVALGLYYWRDNVTTGEIDYDKATREFALAESGLPNDAEIATYIGRIKRHQGQWAESTVYLKKAVELDPRSVERWHRLFYNYEATRNFAAAAGTLGRVLALAPQEDRWRYLNQLAYLQLIWKGELTEVRNLPAPHPNDPTGRHTEELFKNAMWLRDYDKGESILRNDPRETLPSGVPKAFYLGRLYFYRGDASKAVEFYEAARAPIEQTLAANPRDSGVMMDLAEVYARLGRKEDAIRQALKAADLQPLAKDRWQGAMALSSVAATYVMVGAFDEALPLLEQSLRLAGGDYRNALRYEPVWEPIWETPRFQKLLALPDVVVPVTGPPALGAEMKAEINFPAEGSNTGTSNPAAAEAYLKGIYLWNTRDGGRYPDAEKYLRRAIALDPNYARAYAGLSDVLQWMALPATREEKFAEASRAAHKALELDPGLAEGHAALGLIAMNYDWDWAGAEREFQSAIALNPQYPTGHHWYAEYLNCQGRFEEALREINLAIGLSPTLPVLHHDTGKILVFARRYEEAEIGLRETLTLNPNFGDAYFWLTEAHALQGRFPEAFADIEQMEHFYSSSFSAGLAAYVHGLANDRAGAERLLALTQARTRPMDDMLPLAYAYLGLGDKEKALTYLERDCDTHGTAMTALKVAPHFDSLRSEPRFEALLRRVHFLP